MLRVYKKKKIKTEGNIPKVKAGVISVRTIKDCYFFHLVFSLFGKCQEPLKKRNSRMKVKLDSICREISE